MRKNIVIAKIRPSHRRPPRRRPSDAQFRVGRIGALLGKPIAEHRGIYQAFAERFGVKVKHVSEHSGVGRNFVEHGGA